MSDFMTDDRYIKRKKKKTEDVTYSEDASYSEHNELERSENKKKKNKHRSTDDETVTEVSSLDNLSPSYDHRSFVKHEEQENPSEQELSTQDYNSDTLKSPKKRKKKKRKETLVEADLADQTSLYDEHTQSDEAHLSQSLKKKKKRHRLAEARNLQEDISEDVQQKSPLIMLNENTDVESRPLKKKMASVQKSSQEVDPGTNYSTFSDERESKTVGCLSPKVRRSRKVGVAEDINEKTDQENVDVSREEGFENATEATGCETDDDDDNMGTISKTKKSVKHKKSKEKHRDQDVTDEFENLHEDQMETTLNKKTSDPKKMKSDSSFVTHEEQENPSEQELSTLDNNSNTWKSAKKSKKKKIRESSEETLEDTDHTDQTILSDELTHSDETHLSQSVKKKRSRLREARSLEEDISEDVLLKSPLITLNENTDVESRPSKKKKMASAHKSSQEVDTRTNSAFNDEREPKTVGCLTPKVRRSQRVAEAAFNKKRDLENVDVSREEAFENLTEATGCETDDDMGAVSKSKKSAKGKKSKEKHQDQDVTEELENLHEDQMETTLDEETSDPKKRSDRPKQSRLSVSGSEVLSSIREKDLALLEEYFPRIRSMSGRTIKDLISYDLGRIKEAKRQGIKFETGRFDSTEDERIKENVEDFRKLGGLESGEMLFYSYRFPDKMSTIEKLKKKYHFRHRIAEGIARPVTEVSNRGLKLYDLSGNKGRYTKEEVKKLQKGISEHGKDWVTVGKLIGRNSKTVQLKASQLRREVTGGKWSNEEVNRLIQALKAFILRSLKKKKKKFSNNEPQMVPREMLFTGIPWAKIEEKVQTRNWTHCKSKWNDLLLLRMNDGISPCEGVLGAQTTIELINWLHEAKHRKGQVNWLAMAKDIGNIPPGILQQKVYKLKCRNVPGWRKRSLKEIVDYLYTDVLPKAEANLQAALASRGTADMPEKKEKFLISDIFAEYFGDDHKFKSLAIIEDDDDSSSSSS